MSADASPLVRRFVAVLYFPGQAQPSPVDQRPARDDESLATNPTKSDELPAISQLPFESLQKGLVQCLQDINGLHVEGARSLSTSPRIGEITFISDGRTADGPIDAQYLYRLRSQPQLVDLQTRAGVELNFLPDTVFRRHRRLAVFDMDSTLIQQEVIDELARSLGPEYQRRVADITERAMNGELDFTASLRERVGILKGVKASVFEELKSVIQMTQGVPDLIRALKRLGYITAVLSGGFMPLTGWLATQLGLDYAHANNLVVAEDGTLTGELVGDIVNAERKRELVIEIAAKEGIALEQTLVVGDGANDLKMMGVSGLGVAFNAKPRVQIEAPARLNSSSLLDVMHLLGFTEGELAELLRES